MTLKEYAIAGAVFVLATGASFAGGFVGGIQHEKAAEAKRVLKKTVVAHEEAAKVETKYITRTKIVHDKVLVAKDKVDAVKAPECDNSPVIAAWRDGMRALSEGSGSSSAVAGEVR